MGGWCFLLSEPSENPKYPTREKKRNPGREGPAPPTSTAWGRGAAWGGCVQPYSSRTLAVGAVASNVTRAPSERAEIPGPHGLNPWPEKSALAATMLGVHWIVKP